MVIPVEGKTISKQFRKGGKADVYWTKSAVHNPYEELADLSIRRFIDNERLLGDMLAKKAWDIWADAVIIQPPKKPGVPTPGPLDEPEKSNRFSGVAIRYLHTPILLGPHEKLPPEDKKPERHK